MASKLRGATQTTITDYLCGLLAGECALMADSCASRP